MFCYFMFRSSFPVLPSSPSSDSTQLWDVADLKVTEVITATPTGPSPYAAASEVKSRKSSLSSTALAKKNFLEGFKLNTLGRQKTRSDDLGVTKGHLKTQGQSSINLHADKNGNHQAPPSGGSSIVRRWSESGNRRVSVKRFFTLANI